MSRQQSVMTASRANSRMTASKMEMKVCELRSRWEVTMVWVCQGVCSMVGVSGGVLNGEYVRGCAQ